MMMVLTMTMTRQSLKKQSAIHGHVTNVRCKHAITWGNFVRGYSDVRNAWVKTIPCGCNHFIVHTMNLVPRLMAHSHHLSKTSHFNQPLPPATTKKTMPTVEDFHLRQVPQEDFHLVPLLVAYSHICSRHLDALRRQWQSICGRWQSFWRQWHVHMDALCHQVKDATCGGCRNAS